MLTSPKWLLHLEGLIVFVAAIVVYREIGGSWLRFALLFFIPDVSMAAYFFGTKVGATFCNIGHTYASPFLLWLMAYFAHFPSLFFACAIWVAHIGFDRLLGYGLKYPMAFKDTLWVVENASQPKKQSSE